MTLWMLRRLKNVGAGSKILLDLYQKHIRSILEYSVPAWGPLISDENCDEVERVQKCAYKVIFGRNMSYKKQVELSNTLSLAQRRAILTNKFASFAPAHSKSANLSATHCGPSSPPRTHIHTTRQDATANDDQ